MTDSDQDPADATHSTEASAGMPGWVKISLIVGVVLVALFVIVNLVGGGSEHGPGRHSGGGPIPALVAGA